MYCTVISTVKHRPINFAETTELVFFRQLDTKLNTITKLIDYYIVEPLIT